MKNIITGIATVILFSSFNIQQTLVYICLSSGSYAYHSGYCTGLKKCTHEVKQVTITKAKELGKSKPCGYCY